MLWLRASQARRRWASSLKRRPTLRRRHGAHSRALRVQRMERGDVRRGRDARSRAQPRAGARARNGRLRRALHRRERHLPGGDAARRPRRRRPPARARRRPRPGRPRRRRHPVAADRAVRPELDAGVGAGGAAHLPRDGGRRPLLSPARATARRHERARRRARGARGDCRRRALRPR